MTVAVVALAAAGCGESSKSASTGGDKESGKYSGKGIGLAYDIGGEGDQSFNDAAHSGFLKADKDFGIGGKTFEPADGEGDADKVQRLESMAKQGYNPIIGVGFVYAPAIKEVAAKYPDTTFGIIDDASVEAKNVASMVFSEEQASYLAGVAAAKASKSHTVGFIGGVDIPLIHKFGAGFEQGAKAADPKVKVIKKILTSTPQEGGFSSPDKGREAANGQIEQGADVLYHAAGLSGQGVISEAAKNKVWAIGVDSDQYAQDALKEYKDWILGSATKNVGGAVYELAKSVHEGKPLSGTIRGDLKTEGVGFSDTNPKYQAMTEVVEAVNKAKQDIIDAKVTVKTS
ncbi:BMP family lipoprotein [Streptomyces fragilis]|uniref:BMP family ABC transporter substrate-binding protein n=1 Tax=Streptomyces fragilis TaxID=67301 RepID=A0ABV2YIL0_9ACTN|nr:BMP family ABC transporter substrate-binding protein [Streptomyces fragilis]